MGKQQLSKTYLRIAPGKFHFLKFILEGYDNMAILSSYDNKKGIIVIRFPEAMSADLYDLLSSIAVSLSD